MEVEIVRKRNKRVRITCISLLIVMFAVFLLTGGAELLGLKQPQALQQGQIRYRYYHGGENVDIVKQQLREMGFRHVSSESLHDVRLFKLVVGVIFDTSNGKTTEIWIDGAEAEQGKIYDENDPVIVYHHGI